jgi:hypothetical protein
MAVLYGRPVPRVRPSLPESRGRADRDLETRHPKSRKVALFKSVEACSNEVVAVNWFVVAFLLLSTSLLAQTTIPAGTVLPAQLNSTLTSGKSRQGETVTATIMQDVPLSPHRKIKAGAKIVGHVVRLTRAMNGGPSDISLRFDQVKFRHESLSVNTSLRALASMMAVEEVQVPPGGTDMGTPWAWRPRNLIGGEVAYGEGGPVARGTEILGRALVDGVLLPVEANPAAGCRGEMTADSQLQAFWIFSSDACGVYGIAEVEITHAGRTPPVGEVTIALKHGDLTIRAGSGMLFRANTPTQ